MVFLYHNRKYWRDDIPPVLLRFLNELHVGVSVFFVLSGFLIAYTYEDKPLRSGKDYIKYLLIRLARIFPVYLVIISAMYIDQGFPSTKETVLTYTMTHGFSNTYNLNGIPQAWSLTVELSFYTLAPLLYFLLKRNILKTIIALILLLLIVAGIGYGLHALHYNKGSFFYPWFFIFNSSFPGRFPEFLAGMLLAHHITGIKMQQTLVQKRSYTTLIGGLGSIAVIYLISLFEKDIYHEGIQHPAGLIIRNIVFPFTVMLLLYGLIKERTWLQRFLSTRVMILLGGASYIFYLIHIGYVNGKWKEWYLFPDRNFILLWLTAIVGFLLIEKPIYEGLKKLIKGKKL